MRRLPQQATVLAVFVFAVSVFGQPHTPTGRISGSVQTVNGKPVSNATVTVNVRPPKLGDTLQLYNALLHTSADGTFSATGVPKGRFAVCPTAPTTDVLPPCAWEGELIVDVADGEAVTIPTILLKPSVDLYIRVNDPKGTRGSQEGKVAGASLMVGVRSPTGTVVPIPILQSDSGGADHHLAVPADTDLLFLAFSSVFSLTDGNGAAVDKNGLTVPVRIPASQKQHKEVLTIQ